MADPDIAVKDDLNIEETIQSLDKAINEMAARIATGEFDEEHEQLDVDRLNAISNAVDAKRRLIEEAPKASLSELWAEDLKE
ncbi:hypothetical protein [Halorubrum salinum]|uniref:hypothetical protein n=1 Tax=Halorubrum salinum TaxID=767517 RepID=UPI002112E582|nr:hypothetical protein [Halorubrum salinum]